MTPPTSEMRLKEEEEQEEKESTSDLETRLWKDLFVAISHRNESQSNFMVSDVLVEWLLKLAKPWSEDLSTWLTILVPDATTLKIILQNVTDKLLILYMTHGNPFGESASAHNNHYGAQIFSAIVIWFKDPYWMNYHRNAIGIMMMEHARVAPNPDMLNAVLWMAFPLTPKMSLVVACAALSEFCERNTEKKVLTPQITAILYKHKARLVKMMTNLSNNNSVSSPSTRDTKVKS